MRLFTVPHDVPQKDAEIEKPSLTNVSTSGLLSSLKLTFYKSLTDETNNPRINIDRLDRNRRNGAEHVFQPNQSRIPDKHF